MTRGNLFLDVKPSEEFRPWSPTFPPFKINEDLKKLRIYPKLANPVHIRIYRSILETYRLKQDEGVRWYVILNIIPSYQIKIDFLFFENK